MQFKPVQCVKIVEYLSKTQPHLVAEAVEKIEKPEADFDYFFLLLKVRDAFCKRKGFDAEYITGLNVGRQATWERTLFIAICLKLYSPAVFVTDVTYNTEDRVRKELAGMLGIDTPNWISQQIDGIIINMRIYDEFRDQVNQYVEIMKREVNVKHVEQEQQLQLLQ